MTNCCNSYGQCTQGFNCPARESRSEFTANQLLCKPEAPIQYVPRYDDEPPMGYSHDFLAMLAIWVIGVILGAVGLLYFLTWW